MKCTVILEECEMGSYLDGEQVSYLEGLGFSGFEQRKGYDEYYQPSITALEVSMNLEKLHDLADNFLVEVWPAGVILKPR